MEAMQRILTTIAVLALLTSGAAWADVEIPTPTYTGQVVGMGPDYLVLDTDLRGRRLLVIDPDTVFIEPVYPAARLRVEFRVGEDNFPHARLVEPAPDPPLLPVPLERSRGGHAEPPAGQLVEARPAPLEAQPGLAWLLLGPMVALTLSRRR
jgi:hypothetical protein